MLRINRKGFTLIEALVIIAIIGMFIALLVPAINVARHRNDVDYTVTQPIAQSTTLEAIGLNPANKPGWFVVTINGQDAYAFHVSNGRVDDSQNLR